jgi:hypothetical protein
MHGDELRHHLEAADDVDGAAPAWLRHRRPERSGTSVPVC